MSKVKKHATKVLSLRLPEAEQRRLSRYARRHRIPLATAARLAISQHLERDEPLPDPLPPGVSLPPGNPDPAKAARLGGLARAKKLRENSEKS